MTIRHNHLISISGLHMRHFVSLINGSMVAFCLRVVAPDSTDVSAMQSNIRIGRHRRLRLFSCQAVVVIRVLTLLSLSLSSRHHAGEGERDERRVDRVRFKADPSGAQVFPRPGTGMGYYCTAAHVWCILFSFLPGRVGGFYFA